MKKIYFVLNQITSIDPVINVAEISNKLVQYRSISFIVIGKEIENNININGKIDVNYLNINIDNNDILNKEIKSKRKELMNNISSLTTKNDIIISTSYLSSYIIPKGRRFLYYYLGNMDSFLSFKEKIKRNKLRNPDNYIFSSMGLKKKLDDKKKYRGSYQIYPINQLYPTYDLSNKNNTISLIDDDLNNILFSIELANKLKNNNVKFNLNIYTTNDNKLIKEEKKKNNLNNIKIYNEYEIQNVLKSSDLLLYLSTYYAIPLLLIEAMSQSTPLICYKNEATDESIFIIINNKNIEETINEIKEIFIKQKRLEKFKNNIYNNYYNYSNDLIVAKWLDILEIEDNLSYKE